MTAVPSLAVLKPSQVARLFGCDDRTASRWILRGKLPAIKTPGGHWIVRAEVVRDKLVAGGATLEDAEAMVAAVLGRQA